MSDLKNMVEKIRIQRLKTQHRLKRNAAWRLAKRQARAIKKRKHKLRAVRTLIKHIRAALWPA